MFIKYYMFHIYFLFSMFCSVAVISTILSSRSFICASASVILLWIPSGVLFISVYLFCSSYRSFVNFPAFSLCLYSFSEILNHIHYHYSEFFFWRLPISTSFSCFPGVLSYPFIWDVTFCFFLPINFL